MEPYIDVVKLEFMKYVEQHPNPEDVVSYLLQNTFDGPPAMVGMVQRAVRTLAEQVYFINSHLLTSFIYLVAYLLFIYYYHLLAECK